jgi:hypothetical protein
MQPTTSISMLWTEMTDELSETVNGGKNDCYQSYYCGEKPKEKNCESYEEPSYYWEDKQYDKSDYYQSSWW